MSESGYIYVLINPVMHGLVKIGKTKRKPEIRAQELSSATGVPAKFIVAFQEQFKNCDFAEKEIHFQLSRGNFRFSNNREFFNASLNDVIRIILEVKKQDYEENSDDGDSDYLNENVFSKDENLASQISRFLIQGYAYFVGTEDLVEGYYQAIKLNQQNENLYGEGNEEKPVHINYKKAFELFREASDLGSSEADLMLGFMWLNGKGCYPNIDKAIESFVVAGDKGDITAWIELVQIYSFEYEDFEKAYFYLAKYIELDPYGDCYYLWGEIARVWDQKSFYSDILWENYFQSKEFRNGRKSEEDIAKDVKICISYFENRIGYVNRKVDPVFLRYAQYYAREISKACSDLIKKLENDNETKQDDNYSAIYTYRKIISMMGKS